MSHATSKGGKTLLVPTPYAVKMAILDACFRRYNAKDAENRARSVFDLLKRREVRLRPPRHCIVQNTFIKVLDWDRDRTSGPFRNTIVYREFAFFGGDQLQIALGVSGFSPEEDNAIGELFAHINSIGKRGSFWQFDQIRIMSGELPFGFTAQTVLLGIESESPDELAFESVGGNIDVMGLVSFEEIRPNCTEITLAVHYEIKNKLFAWMDRRFHFVDAFVTSELRSIRAHFEGIAAPVVERTPMLSMFETATA